MKDQFELPYHRELINNYYNHPIFKKLAKINYKQIPAEPFKFEEPNKFGETFFKLLAVTEKQTINNQGLWKPNGLNILINLSEDESDFTQWLEAMIKNATNILETTYLPIPETNNFLSYYIQWTGPVKIKGEILDDPANIPLELWFRMKYEKELNKHWNLVINHPCMFAKNLEAHPDDVVPPGQLFYCSYALLKRSGDHLIKQYEVFTPEPEKFNLWTEF